ncbi:hypothetical protein ANAPC1_00101 [Anaplasma phagocytophilum]|uniref:Uncharacterized protein n=4 Tax=Anaplasma phagocytophilum TaxID=948 RepID=A0AA45US08_ANAPH|nr:hypothetical protein APH_0967 [Anaplasma phagocytophilum str. HZ]AGR79583.1 hypothetical protein YYU_04420 [Anaplasma phagocytophilum str. HZ2]AGR80839.1 hypothetical protein WSQ_04455 [Anaplasma phagocytophilum str. JM]AGR82092.1 hypothetical protein YYY_04450 [Anaplasma phagocytophilum str. Dog2]EOA61212.1 hypothetical protein HGE1_04132 [Anaplasma phagocytophilum str. HGE1]EOA62399.1 hypothetical protein CRT38_04002 [Anaplasma phagocytophilum str. CRT38]SBO13764.1 hypothetical protein A
MFLLVGELAVWVGTLRAVDSVLVIGFLKFL